MHESKLTNADFKTLIPSKQLANKSQYLDNGVFSMQMQHSLLIQSQSCRPKTNSITMQFDLTHLRPEMEERKKST